MTVFIADEHLQFPLSWSLAARLILSSVSFYAFIISFFFLNFLFFNDFFFVLFITYSGCYLQVVKLLARNPTQLIHWVIKVILRLFHDVIHNVVFTKRRTQWKDKWLWIWKQVVLTYFKFISLQSPDKNWEDKGSVQWR
jgi:hypothetical protein